MFVCVPVYDLTIGPSVRARRDRQNLTKNRLQLDNESSIVTDMHLQDLEQSDILLPSHKDSPLNSSTPSSRKRKMSDVVDAVINETCHPLNVGDGDSLLPIVDETKDCNVELPGSALCLREEVTNASAHSRPLTDVCNVISATKTLGTSVIVENKDSKKCRLPSAAASNEPLPKKSRSHTAKGKSVDCSRPASVKDLPHHKTVNRQSASKQLATEGQHRELTHGSSLSSRFADNVGNKISYECNSALKRVQNNDCSSRVDSSNATNSASDSDLKKTKSSAASREQNVTLSVNKQATANSVTLGSLIGMTMHKTVTPDATMSQPNVVKRQQSRVRFEGNHRWFHLLVITVVTFDVTNYLVL